MVTTPRLKLAVPSLDATERFRLQVGGRLKRLREDRRLERSEIADAVGISYPTIRLYELGARPIPLETAVRIAAVLDVTIVELLQ